MNERLKKIREKMNMNMREFSNFLGVKYTTYVGYENGSREPGSDFLAQVANFCNTTTDYILGVTDDDGMLPAAKVIDFAEAQDQLRIILSEDEYAMLRAYQAADDRARKDALLLLTENKKVR